jgi:hypothetical protein
LERTAEKRAPADAGVRQPIGDEIGGKLQYLRFEMLTAPSAVLTDFVFNEEEKPQRHKEHKEFYLFFVLFVSLWFNGTTSRGALL